VAGRIARGKNNKNKIMDYKELKRHIGHPIVCVGYALQDTATGKRLSNFENIAIECEKCNEVIISKDRK
jgi:hypothetical protein